MPGELTIEPLDQIDRVVHPARKRRSRGRDHNHFECRCGTRTSSGSVVTDPPEFDEAEGCFAVVRRFACADCQSIVIWKETASRDGRPRGTILSGPGWQCGQRYLDFLRRHSFATPTVPD
ncbi:MAG: hypothetical protein AAGE65_03595 [Planctomycetota bacterium]